MAITTSIGENGQTICKYLSPSQEDMFAYFKALSDVFEKYLEKHNFQNEDIKINKSMIGEIIKRTDKRKEYFIIYHNETYINEIKEAALVAYWVLKFHPFTLVYDINTIERAKLRINEGFAAFVLLSAIKQHHKKNCSGDFPITETYVKKLLYAFKYWDLSKEAIMLIGETLGAYC